MWKDHRWKQCTTKEILQISFQRCNKPWPENISYHVIFYDLLKNSTEYDHLMSVFLCMLQIWKLNSVLLLRLFHCRMKDTLLMLALSHFISKEKWKGWENAVSMSFTYLIWRPEGTSSYYCDGWSEKRISKLLNSYFILPYKLYWSPFFISFNSCLIFVNLGCCTTILSDNVWRWFVKLFFPFIFSVS